MPKNVIMKGVTITDVHPKLVRTKDATTVWAQVKLAISVEKAGNRIFDELVDLMKAGSAIRVTLEAVQEDLADAKLPGGGADAAMAKMKVGTGWDGATKGEEKTPKKKVKRK